MIFSVDAPIGESFSVASCKAHSIYNSYKDTSIKVEAFKTDFGVSLIGFSSKLFVWGEKLAVEHQQEIINFARLLGCCEIESQIPLESLKQANSYTVLKSSGVFNREKISFAQNTTIAFEILASCDESFKANVNRLEWLSFITRGINSQAVCQIVIDEAATATIIIGDSCGYITAVGVAPQQQGKGLGGKAVAAALSYCRENNLLPLTVPQSPSLIAFYEKQGFAPTEQQLYCYTL